MSKNAANEGDLGLVHTLFTEWALNYMKGAKDSGWETIDVQSLKVIMQFMKENSISANEFIDSNISEIKDKLKDFKTSFKEAREASRKRVAEVPDITEDDLEKYGS
jgi:hypothetical protein